MKRQDFKIQRLNIVDSTNDYLKNLVKSGDCEPKIVIANMQTNGKGTKNRSFISKEGGIYLSILLKPFEANLITPMTAVAVSDTIEQISNKKTEIKWVNDVYLNSKKVCGILCESVFSDNSEKPFIIVGIGVNLFTPKGGFDSQISNISTSVFEKENSSIKEKFIDELLNNFFNYFNASNQKAFIKKYRDKNLLLGKKVTVIHNNINIDGVAVDIDDNCHLAVKFDDGSIKYFSSGDIFLKNK